MLKPRHVLMEETPGAPGGGDTPPASPPAAPPTPPAGTPPADPPPAPPPEAWAMPDKFQVKKDDGSIDLEAADPDLLQVEHQGIELAKDSELLAALGGEGAFGQTIAH